MNEVNAQVTFGEDPSWLFRAKKNKTELNYIEQAHVYDGIAFCKLLAWVDTRVNTLPALTERAVAEKLKTLREETSKKFKFYYLCESFPTVSAFGANAGKPHYSVIEMKENGAEIQGDSLFLIDTGAQYENGGTTDITRTIAVGTPSSDQIEQYTRVLKGHIALATAHFPNKIPGAKLDSFARHFLWQAGLDYNHGTGHGVGSYLAVHESPGSIFSAARIVPLEEGMVLSNEPGYYTEKYGIRIENIMRVIASDRDGFLKFQTISLAPLDKRLINVKMLTKEEIDWINSYHAHVFDSLAPYIRDEIEVHNWLKAATSKLEQH